MLLRNLWSSQLWRPSDSCDANCFPDMPWYALKTSNRVQIWRLQDLTRVTSCLFSFSRLLKSSDLKTSRLDACDFERLWRIVCNLLNRVEPQHTSGRQKRTKTLKNDTSKTFGDCLRCQHCCLALLSQLDKQLFVVRQKLRGVQIAWVIGPHPRLTRR